MGSTAIRQRWCGSFEGEKGCKTVVRLAGTGKRAKIKGPGLAPGPFARRKFAALLAGSR